MIRNIVVPLTNTLLIDIPDAYIGKEIEYLVFDAEESLQIPPQKTPTVRTGGVEKIFEGKRISLKHYKFDRNEANDYDE